MDWWASQGVPAIRYWICDENQQAREVTQEEWYAWLRGEGDGTHPDIRRVDATSLPNGGRVSTVFLSADHDFLGLGPPVLWETMVFGVPGFEDYQKRYSSVEAAREGHGRVVVEVIAGLARHAMEGA